jgi:hypothetical protein
MHIFKSAARRFQAGPAVCPTSQPRMGAEIGPSFLNPHGEFLICYSNPLTHRGRFLLYWRLHTDDGKPIQDRPPSEHSLRRRAFYL